MSEYILQMKNCRKEFPGVVALNNVSLYLKRGEVHGLMGENGAGKSTIMKILAGIYTLDGGEIFLNDEKFMAKNPVDALEKGISMIHQELDLIPDMTVEENIFAGREETNRLGVVKKKHLIERTQQLLNELKLDIRPGQLVRELSVAQMQMVAIVKATAFDADIIIMDEPTSAITDREVEKLFEVIAQLKAQNKAIVYISHKMDEIFRICDRITVMRDGALIGTKGIGETDNDDLVRMMVGRDLTDMYVKSESSEAPPENREELLRVEGLTRKGEFQDISFTLRKGEVLGVSGLMGAGRTEVMETVFGLRKADRGSIAVKGREVNITRPGQAIRNGLAFISEDRKLYGLNLVGSVKTNITLSYMKKILRGNLLLDFQKEKGLVDKKIQELKIKTSSRDTIVGTLSGGNQQKVIIAKWLLGNPDILIMDEPTRGIDVGAKSEIYKIIDDLVKQGKGVIMISSEMPELLGMSDRAIVMHDGMITGEFSRSEFDQEKIMACAIGEGVKKA